jgi:hypothetical protein
LICHPHARLFDDLRSKLFFSYRQVRFLKQSFKITNENRAYTIEMAILTLKGFRTPGRL